MSCKGEMVRVAVATSYKFLVPFKFSEYIPKKFHPTFFDRVVGTRNAPQNTLMLCVLDENGLFVVLHEEMTYVTIKGLFELVNQAATTET